MVFEQWLDERVLALESSLQLELDAGGVVRTAHAYLYPDLEGPPAFVLDPEEALALAEAEAGDLESFQRVVHDRADPRAGWLLSGAAGRALVDDASAALLWWTPPILTYPMEVHYPVPNPLLDTRRGVASHTVVARGDTSGAVPAGLSTAERGVWATMSTIVGQVEARTGNAGWRTSPIRVVTQDAVAEGRLTLPDGSTVRTAGAFYMPGRGTMFLDGDARHRRETICHEYGHGFDDAHGGVTYGTFAECLADVFYIFCEPWVNPGGIAYAYNESGRRHDRPYGRADQFDYEAFRALRIRERDIGRGAMVGGSDVGVHDHAFLVTHAFYHMMETYRLNRDRAMRLGFAAAAGTYSTYPELRDRVVADAVSWAQSGRHGFTEADACAVARGFRHTNLDGEYGSGTNCERSSRTDLICTSRYCPVCGVTEPPPVCRPETLAEGQPVCMTADGRRTCVGSVALSNQGCPSGQGRQCWCVGDGRWDCTNAGECRPLSDQPLYCPETTGPSAAGGGSATPACTTALHARPALAWAPWLLALVLVALRRRR